MMHNDRVFIGSSIAGGQMLPQHLLLKLANRHGLIAGATGTGKTVSLQILAEGFSAQGVPVFAADVKGDLAGIAVPGEPRDFLQSRADKIGFTDYTHGAFPVVFWDLFGKSGHSIRTTVTEMGPLLLSRLLGLNETQEGILTIAFRIADDQGLALLDMKDLRAMLVFLAQNATEISAEYGNVSKASVGAIQRRLLTLEDQGADHFFGEPALDIRDFMRTTRDGRGIINILAADTLMQSPQLYATFLLWMLAELFEELPEVGNPDKPKLVFFFDEAHLLFDEAPKALLQKVEQVVRLIRSKGVGVYFVTQNPTDVPDVVLGQLGNRVQHALRAFTPRDQRAVRAAAQTFRQNPQIDITTVIGELGVGEALVSTLEKKGVPSIVQRTLVRPPSSRMGPITKSERRAVMEASPLVGIYDTTVDRQSAYELLKKRRSEEEDAVRRAQAAKHQAPSGGGILEELFGGGTPRRGRSRRSDTLAQSVVRSVANTVGRQLGRALVRGLFGSLRR
ncbi:MAG: helicase HerA-like C-terminal domain-containing protein [Alphaproteobacteria bacterium]